MRQKSYHQKPKKLEKQHEELKYRYRFEKLIAKVSSEFSGKSGKKIDPAINRALSSIGNFTKADRAYIFRFNSSGTLADNTHEWCAAGVTPQIENLKNINIFEELPWFAEHIRKNAVFHVPDVSALPQEALLETYHFETQNIRSLIVVPMENDEGVIGFLGFDSIRDTRVWSDDDIALLQFFGRTLSKLMERKRVEEALQDSEELYRTLFEYAGDYVLVLEVIPNDVPIILEANEAALLAHGYQREELIGKPVSLIDPFSHQKFFSAIIQKLDGKQHQVFNVRHQRKNGSIFEVEVKATSLELKARKIILSVERDITERRRLEQILLLRLHLWEYIATHSLNEVIQLALDEIGNITDSPIGFYHFIEQDQKTISLQAWSSRTLEEFCKAESSGMHYSLEAAGVWTDCVRKRQPIIHNNYKTLPDRKGLPPGHAEIMRELVVPIIRSGSIVSILGVGNKPTDYDEKDIELVTHVANVTWEIIEHKRMEEALKESEKRFRELSIIDGLTGLYNSRHFYSQLKTEIDRVNRYKEPMTLILFDIDNFKAFNDTYGHLEGDRVLMRLGKLIKKCLRETDSAYRYGGEEFIILLPVTTCKDGIVTAERVGAEFKKENFSPLSRHDVHMTLSIGVCQYEPNEEMKAFVRRVDQMMYLAKKNGKDRVCHDSVFLNQIKSDTPRILSASTQPTK
jgi:diguanylate cyclase (GGDEF)-like protein/PAS domain S-box-containing protein